jgi:polygalacturonase
VISKSSGEEDSVTLLDNRRRDFFKIGGVGVVGAVRAMALGPEAASTSNGTTNFEVKAFGAAGDGKTLDTPAIDKAIRSASVAGGTVVFGPGKYLCYSLHLKSNVALYLSPGATIIAADFPSASGSGGYDPAEPNAWDQYQDFGHSHWHNSLMWGENLDNFSIFGPGLIWGKGLSRGSGDKVLENGVGNKAISLKNCRNVTFRDFSILHGGHFAILATGVDNLTIDNLKIDTNRDGIDVDCCRNVRISNCSVNSPWDDAICPKSSFALGYARPTDNVTIANCYVTGGYEEGTLLNAAFQPISPDKAPRNGRIKFGTESNGGFRNITVSNCVLELCRGIALETVDGGVLEDVSISNITMRGPVDVPFFIRLGSRMRGPAGAPVGQLRRVKISDVVVSNAASQQASIISGIPDHRIEDLSLSDISVAHRGGRTTEDAKAQPAELEKDYPDPNRFGPMPVHGFFVRHAKGISFRDVDVRYEKEDLRPAILLDDVVGADFTHVKMAHGQGIPTFVLSNVEDFNLDQSRPTPDTHLDKVVEQAL